MPTTKKMWIKGEWVSARGGKTRDIVNPASGAVLAQVQLLGLHEDAAPCAVALVPAQAALWGPDGGEVG